ncbi:XRE family transcriptional regulator [Streptomyces sp. SudanB182_2057]|uniref:XRE family transcriptional regulator n=1 Tax=Streptomyces sp. SudanB182_2057 TaxID=3035281 RepID=UPI003F56ECE4
MTSERTIRQQRCELEQARARLIEHVQAATGRRLTAARARTVLEQAKAWAPAAARELDRHLTTSPDALSAPTSYCPATLVRLAHLLVQAGFAHAVTKVKCARCSRTDPLPLRPSPEGRCCGWCVSKARVRNCGRCGQDGHIVTRREDGPICRRCYRSDPLVVTECAGCGHQRAAGTRLDDGTVLCTNCIPRPERACTRCGISGRHKYSAGDGAPLCKRCYQAPRRRCGICGEFREIAARQADGRTDACTRCYRGRKETCSACGRLRHGRRSLARAGAFLCFSCWPRPISKCADCTEMKPAHTTWPLGTLCSGCYQRRTHVPAPCSACGRLRVMVARGPDGRETCRACCGLDTPAVRCRHCKAPDDIYDDGRCPRCVLTDRVHDLLSPDGSTVPAPLTPLTHAGNPYAVLAWLRRSRSAKLLAARPTLHRTVVTFIHWAVKRRVTGELTITRPPSQGSSEVLNGQDLHDQLRRCLNDDTLPREARIIGALIRLYALPVSRIVHLTTNRFHRDENGAYLTLDRHPVLLPPKLALLIEEQIAQPVTDSRMRQQLDDTNGYLFPGKAPGRPRSAAATHHLLNECGLPVRSARNTAMIEAVTSLPPIVVADLFGIHPNTAQKWANYTKDDWSAYLAARMDTE